MCALILCGEYIKQIIQSIIRDKNSTSLCMDHIAKLVLWFFDLRLQVRAIRLYSIFLSLCSYSGHITVGNVITSYKHKLQMSKSGGALKVNAKYE